MTASLNVGWGWTAFKISWPVVSNFLPTTASEIISVTLLPIIWHPSHSPYFESNITFTNPSGEIVHSINLGSQEKGLVGFSWENIPDEIKKNKTRLTIQAYAGNGEASDGISTAVYNKVIAASAPKNSEDVILETKDYGEISANDAIKLKTND